MVLNATPQPYVRQEASLAYIFQRVQHQNVLRVLTYHDNQTQPLVLAMQINATLFLQGSPVLSLKYHGESHLQRIHRLFDNLVYSTLNIFLGKRVSCRIVL